MGQVSEIKIDPKTVLAGNPRKMLIDGEWVDALSGETFDTINPANGEVLATLPKGGKADVDRAVAAARRAFEGDWSRLTPFDRQGLLIKLGDLIERHFDEIAMTDTLDMGGPISRTLLGRRRAVGLCRYYAGMATSVHGASYANSAPGNPLSYSVKEPVGVVGAINPWNGPFGLSLWKITPALAAGCTIVLKPAEQAPLSPLVLGKLCMEAGIPPGVVNIVTGFGDAGAAIAEHPGIDKVAFTGSTEVGQSIIRASAGNTKRVSMELGGKSPNIVFADANLAKAIPAAAMAVFMNSGQICSAGTRLFIEHSIYDEVIDGIAAFTRTLKLGDPTDPATDLGPLVTREQYEKVAGYIESGLAQGAQMKTDPDWRPGGDMARGNYIAPTLFSEVQDDMKICREEIFGPVISAIRFSSIDEAIRRANDTPYGLGSGVWTRDINKANKVAAGLQAGSVWVNCYQQLDPAVPFGGYKMSGFGRESGPEHIEEFLNTKAIWVMPDEVA
ncbi:aldehyde dehydrogenase family protein [Mesobacterium pallidum]|uniref:aldehyde dehydrogenase family protein n=1 Tax=Mesobacterium pallidum TaxID=2872037 RepID=UPI001EE16F09|nr:aldehyde dehydrogenase family protein [Mesobacterium pallidum]